MLFLYTGKFVLGRGFPHCVRDEGKVTPGKCLLLQPSAATLREVARGCPEAGRTAHRAIPATASAIQRRARNCGRPSPPFLQEQAICASGRALTVHGPA